MSDAMLVNRNYTVFPGLPALSLPPFLPTLLPPLYSPHFPMPNLPSHLPFLSYWLQVAQTFQFCPLTSQSLRSEILGVCSSFSWVFGPSPSSNEEEGKGGQ